MFSTERGGPAFPQTYLSREVPTEAGMTQEDYFAGQALVGLLANPEFARMEHPQVVGNAWRIAGLMLLRGRGE
jgi:hypothetical protein